MLISGRALLGVVLTVAAVAMTAASGCGLFASVDRDLSPQTEAGGGTGGTGGSGECSIPADCPGSDSTCAAHTCVQAVCGVELAASGTSCNDAGGTVCDGYGSCVGCLDDSHCNALSFCDTAQKVCQPGPCANGTQDGEETDIDCGGSECAGCAVGETCVVFTDCASHRCEAEVCEACASDLDCELVDYCLGDACIPKKPNAETCAADNECISAHCADGYCCDNKCQLDCQSCSQAGEEGTCVLAEDGTDPDDDCLSGFCGGGAACSCSDGVMNGDESDTDCGGPACDPC